MEYFLDDTPFTEPFAPDLVMFDLDGTLVDSVPSLAMAVDRMLQDLGREPVGVEAVRPWVGNGASMLVRRSLCGNLEAEDEISPELQQQAEELFSQHYTDCLCEGVALYPGVREFLQTLAEKKTDMAVVTNKPERFVAPLLESLEIDHFFSIIVGGDSLESKKPDPAPINHVLSTCKVEAIRALMVGDSATDIEAARNAFVPVACVSYGYNHGEPIAEKQPDWVVDSMMELL